MIDVLLRNIIARGGKIKPLIIPFSLSKGTGLCNPSVFVEEEKIHVCLRGVQYIMLHTENEQRFQSTWGPLVYMNPADDVTLRTTNFYLELNNNLDIIKSFKIDTSLHDKPPVWEFIGLEDARIFKWEDKYWICGVRRDTKINGQGRMELSEIVITDDDVKEINRYRIEPPVDSYCEKNWMPILDRPFHFVKWINPTEIVKVDYKNLSSEIVIYHDKHINLPRELRGGSSVIHYKKHYYAISHEVEFFSDYNKKKDTYYYHRFIIWDEKFNLVKITDFFNFIGARVEFCVGMCQHNDDILITFGYVDNTAYIFSMPIEQWEDMIWKI